MGNQIPKVNASWHRYQFSQSGRQQWISQWDGASEVRLFSKGWHWGPGSDTTVPFSLLLFLLCNLTLVQEEEILGLNWRQSAQGQEGNAKQIGGKGSMEIREKVRLEWIQRLDSKMEAKCTWKAKYTWTLKYTEPWGDIKINQAYLVYYLSTSLVACPAVTPVWGRRFVDLLFRCLSWGAC